MRTSLLSLIAALLTLGVYAQPCASFTSSVSQNVVTFTNTSSCNQGFQYMWSFGDGNTGWGHVVTHTYSAAGTYGVNLSVWDSTLFIDSTFATVTVTMPPPPPSCRAMFSKSQAVDSNGTPYPGHVLITDLSSGSNLSYFWDFGDGNSSTAQNPTHTYTGNGPYYLCLTITDSVCADTYCDTIAIDSNGNILKRSVQGFTLHVGSFTPPAPTGIQDIESNSFALFPNPASDKVVISTNGVSTPLNVSVISVSGQVVMSGDYTPVSSRIELDVNHLESGMYFVRVNAGEAGQQTLKVLVE